MVKIEIMLTESDMDKLYEVKEILVERDIMSFNDFAKGLLIGELHRLYRQLVQESGLM